MSTRLLNWRQIAERINRSRSWIFAAVRARRFPPPLDLPDLPGRALWTEASISDWLDQQVAAAKARAEAGARTAPGSARPNAVRRERKTAGGQA